MYVSENHNSKAFFSISNAPRDQVIVNFNQISDNFCFNGLIRRSFLHPVLEHSLGTLSIHNEMARRRRAEVKFSHARVLRMCHVVKTSSSLRRRLNLSRFSFW